MITFCFVFAFITFLCLFIASFTFLFVSDPEDLSKVKFCMYFSLILTVLTLGCMFWVQETHPDMFQSPVSKLINCSLKPGKVI